MLFLLLCFESVGPRRIWWALETFWLHLLSADTIHLWHSAGLSCDLSAGWPWFCPTTNLYSQLWPLNYLTLQHCRSDCSCTTVEEENQLYKQLLLLQTRPQPREAGGHSKLMSFLGQSPQKVTGCHWKDLVRCWVPYIGEATPVQWLSQVYKVSKRSCYFSLILEPAGLSAKEARREQLHL